MSNSSGPSPIYCYRDSSTRFLSYVNGSILGATLIVCGLYVVLWGKGKEQEMMNGMLPSKSLREPEPTISVVIPSATTVNGIEHAKEHSSDSNVDN